MKLVELLATEIAEWHEKSKYAMQDADGNIYFVKAGEPKWKEEWGQWAIGAASISMNYDQARYGENLSVSDDFKETKVTRAQWQAERDRQKGGEWKRHRGGKQPVADDVRVEVKLRDGDTQEAKACAFLWNHSDCDTYANIMQYRVISQPQAEEVEYRGPFPCAPIGEAVNAIEYDIEFPSGVFTLEAKTDQIDGPIKWRDTINELDAYIEEFTREREALINRLAMEGFALLPAIAAVMGISDVRVVGVEDYRKWESGDLVTCKVDYNRQFTKVRQYTVTSVGETLGCGRVSVLFDDKGAANGWLANQFEFHSRP